jgi:hypothetical protein
VLVLCICIWIWMCIQSSFEVQTCFEWNSELLTYCNH